MLLFQFPTGWNSTVGLKITVFPVICFNSQRDGILRYSGKNLEMRMSVSIPNGMEFYQNPIRLGRRIFTRFNSQRDGILQHEFCHFSR